MSAPGGTDGAMEPFIMPRRHVDSLMVNRILLLASNPNNNDETSNVKQSLQRNGFTVTTTDNAVGHIKHDLIIVMVSPHLDYSLAKRTILPTLFVVTHEEAPAIFPVLFTGRSHVDVICKPILMPLLLHKVETMIWSRMREASYDTAVRKHVNTSWLQLNTNNDHTIKLPQMSDEVIKSMQGWDFDMRQYSDLQYVVLLREMFRHFRLPDLLNFDVSKLDRLLLRIREHYFKNQYHNFAHAFDVTQSAFSMLTLMKIEQYFTPLDIFIFLLACIGHDVEHPGCSNQHLIQSNAELAIRYHDRSCLENHHSYVLFSLLFTPECNVMSNFTPQQRKQARSQIIQSILLTDMMLHPQHMTNIQRQVSNSQSKTCFVSKDSEKDRSFLIDLLVHVADLANIVKPFHLSKYWCENITLELFKQGAKDRNDGLTVLTALDECETSCAKNMALFIDTTCLTFFERVMELLPETQPFLKLIITNRMRWQEILVEEECTK